MRLSGTLLASAIIAALAGFLFGFDTVVISGAEQNIQALWQLSDTMHGLTISAALWGTVVGSAVGGQLADRLGRKRTLLGIGILYFVSTSWSAIATGPYTFIVARLIGGLGVGISTVAAPLYITEIAPPEARGRLTGMFQFNIVFGILAAFVSNSLLRGTSEQDWRWMLGVASIPSLLYTLLCLRVPESPRWLINIRGDRAAGLKVLRQVNPVADDNQLASLADSIEHHLAGDAKGRGDATAFWSARLRRPILLAFLIAMFNQLSGINAILYFAPRILGMTGLEGSATFIQTIGIGITNLVFTMLGLWLIDRIGRRTLLYIGSIGYIAALGSIAAVFIVNDAPFRLAADGLAARDAYTKLTSALTTGNLPPARMQLLEKNASESLAALNATLAAPEFEGTTPHLPISGNSEQVQMRIDQVLIEASEMSGNGGKFVLWGIFAFIAAHAIGQGAVIWVFISEIFPNEHRASGQSFGSTTHWVFAALLTLVFPAFVTLFSPGYVFGFFCFMMILQLLWVATMVPETKGVSLELIQEQLGIV